MIERALILFPTLGSVLYWACDYCYFEFLFIYVCNRVIIFVSLPEFLKESNGRMVTLCKLKGTEQVQKICFLTFNFIVQ